MGLMDYLMIIKEPMDLGTVKKKLDRKEYTSESSIRSDIDLIWANCKRYNQPGSDIYRAAEKMEKLCKSRLTNSNCTQGLLRKRNPQDETKEQEDGSMAAKVLFFKKVKELDSTKLRELVQELINKHPSCIKEATFFHLD